METPARARVSKGRFCPSQARGGVCRQGRRERAGGGRWRHLVDRVPDAAHTVRTACSQRILVPVSAVSRLRTHESVWPLRSYGRGERRRISETKPGERDSRLEVERQGGESWKGRAGLSPSVAGWEEAAGGPHRGDLQEDLGGAPRGRRSKSVTDALCPKQ